LFVAAQASQQAGLSAAMISCHSLSLSEKDIKTKKKKNGRRIKPTL